MGLELLLGALGGWLYAQFYWLYLFEPYPPFRRAIWGVLPAAVGALFSAWAFELLLSLVSRRRRGVRFLSRPFGSSLLFHGLLQVEGMKLAGEGFFSASFGAIAAALIGLVLSAQWASYRRLQDPLLQEERPTVPVLASAKTAKQRLLVDTRALHSDRRRNFAQQARQERLRRLGAGRSGLRPV
ncbi:MAG: hypothetical protein KatS3mg115_0675 [Candidatus Poribacteria bacterium]|nr:MAG: hypothetical protein KatS3mg115_0675 [Candidatus Poribacteria bacterium]